MLQRFGVEKAAAIPDCQKFMTILCGKAVVSFVLKIISGLIVTRGAEQARLRLR